MGTLDLLALGSSGSGLALLMLQRLLLAVLLKESHALHQVLRQLGKLHLGILVFRALGVTAVENLPEIADELGVLSLLLVVQMRQLLDLVCPDQRRLLLRSDDRLVGRNPRAVHRADGEESCDESLCERVEQGGRTMRTKKKDRGGMGRSGFDEDAMSATDGGERLGEGGAAAGPVLPPSPTSNYTSYDST